MLYTLRWVSMHGRPAQVQRDTHTHIHVHKHAQTRTPDKVRIENHREARSPWLNLACVLFDVISSRDGSDDKKYGRHEWTHMKWDTSYNGLLIYVFGVFVSPPEWMTVNIWPSAQLCLCAKNHLLFVPHPMGYVTLAVRKDGRRIIETFPHRGSIGTVAHLSNFCTETHENVVWPNMARTTTAGASINEPKRKSTRQTSSYV